MRNSTYLFFALLLSIGCGEDESEPVAVATPTTIPNAAELIGENVPEEQETSAPTAEANGGNDEACVRGVVVAWDGATPTPPGVTRTEDEARALARTYYEQAEAGESIESLARAHSDAPTSRARGGILGTFSREEWPAMHEVLKDPVFALGVGMHADVLQAPYGFVVMERCAVERIHARHILVRYAGARNAPDDVTRSQDAARDLAHEIRQAVTAAPDTFENVAREQSEDGSSEQGGDIGNVARGQLYPAFEAAAFALQDNAISEVVESPVGFHVIQRLP